LDTDSSNSVGGTSATGNSSTTDGETPAQPKPKNKGKL